MLVGMLLSLGLLLPSTACSDDAVLLVHPDASELYQRVEKSFAQHLAQACEATSDCNRIDLDATDKMPEDAAKYQLVIPLGHQASTQAAGLPRSTSQLHLLVSQTRFANPDGCCSDASAIFLEQPVDRQLAFIKALLPERQRVGVLLSPESDKQYRQPLLKAADKLGLELVLLRIEDAEQLGPTLHGMRGQIDVLLALPDPAIYNRNTLANVLLSTYRYRIPVIGFSAGLVKAGALGSVFSSPEQLGQQAAELALQILENPEARIHTLPNRQTFAVNRQVARSLGLKLPTDDELHAIWSDQP